MTTKINIKEKGDSFRWNFYIKKKNYELLKKSTKVTPYTMAQILNRLIEERFANNIKARKEQLKKLQKAEGKLIDEINYLQKKEEDSSNVGNWAEKKGWKKKKKKGLNNDSNNNQKTSL